MKIKGNKQAKNTCLNVRVIFSNSGRGLQTDADLLRSLLKAFGCEVEYEITAAWSVRKTVFSHRAYKLKSWLPKYVRDGWNALQVKVLGLGKPRVDVQIHLETASISYLACAKENWLIPNQEWVRTQHIDFLKYFTKILCKTTEAHNIMRQFHNAVECIGFSNPLFNRLPLVIKNKNRMQQFLHVAGANRKKGTLAIVEAWKRHPDWPDLHLVVDDSTRFNPIPQNIHIWRRPDQDMLNQLRQICGVVLAPSEVEGYGHSLIEAMAFQQLVVTTDAPPMNELVHSDRGYLLPWETRQPCHLGTRYFVSANTIETTISNLIMTSPSILIDKAQKGRDWGVNNHQTFSTAILSQIDSISDSEMFENELDASTMNEH